MPTVLVVLGLAGCSSVFGPIDEVPPPRSMLGDLPAGRYLLAGEHVQQTLILSPGGVQYPREFLQQLGYLPPEPYVGCSDALGSRTLVGALRTDGSTATVLLWFTADASAELTVVVGSSPHGPITAELRTVYGNVDGGTPFEELITLERIGDATDCASWVQAP